METKLKGIALILFAIFLNISAEPIHDIFFSDLSYVDYIIIVASVFVGLAGIILALVAPEKLEKRKK